MKNRAWISRSFFQKKGNMQSKRDLLLQKNYRNRRTKTRTPRFCAARPFPSRRAIRLKIAKDMRKSEYRQKKGRGASCLPYAATRCPRVQARYHVSDAPKDRDAPAGDSTVAAPAAFAAALRSARAQNTGLHRAFWAGPAVFEKKKAEYSTFEAAEQLL
jgi:hypothetical protein